MRTTTRKCHQLVRTHSQNVETQRKSHRITITTHGKTLGVQQGRVGPLVQERLAGNVQPRALERSHNTSLTASRDQSPTDVFARVGILMKQQKHGAKAPEATPRKTLQAGRKWLGRLALLTLAPPLTLLLLEGALRLFHYGYPTSFFVPAEPEPGYVSNEKFAWQFFSKNTNLKPFLFKLADPKPRDTVRICVLGESAAMGTPDPAFSFGRILELGLRDCYPQKHFEVINAAMRGINSYAIRSITKACAAHQVDIFIIYMGNNEIIGLHGPDPFTRSWTQSLTLLRVYQCLRSSKLGQLFDLVRLSPLQHEVQDMAYFREHSLPADDPRRLRAYDNFRANLQDMCRIISGSGARTLLCAVPVNLQDCPTLHSGKNRVCVQVLLPRSRLGCAAIPKRPLHQPGTSGGGLR